MNDGVSTAGSRFGWVRPSLSIGTLADGRIASTHRNIEAFLNFLNQAIITPVMNNRGNRDMGRNLASA
jgi:hypothetical protein